MAIKQYDDFHTPVIPEGARRCEYTLSNGYFCNLLEEEHEVTPDLAEQVIRALASHPTQGVSRAAQDLGNEFAIFDDKDWFVTTGAVITLRVENMVEEDAKPYFDEKWQQQGLSQRLRDAVEDTDFHITFDMSDTEVEEATG